MTKKAAQATPNQRLRRARLERGWTQRVVAERIGAPNDIMVTRWECGTAFPSAYYIERLCQLFEQRASELGLLPEQQPTVSSHSLADRPRRPGSIEERASEPVSSTSPLTRTASPLSHLPLIGREADARTLRDSYQFVQQGQTQVVIIQGEAGIGKTHLASSFLQWSATQGAALLQGRAFEMGGRLPYQALAHALSRRFQAEPAPETLLGATWLSELSRILPELGERYPSLPRVTGDEMTARIRLFEAVTRLLQALGERSPVVLFLDDVQWADTASLDVLHYAGQRWNESGTPLLLLLSMRSEALATATPVSRWLASLHAALPVTEFTLGPLTQDETLHLLDALGTGHTRSNKPLDHLTDLGQWLFRETHGQPFYLVETLRVLLERQILTLHRSSEGEEGELDLSSLSAAQKQSVLAPNVRRLILSQLELLQPPGRAMIRASAILGQRASFDLLCRVADLSEEEALAALDEALGHGLLREVSEEDGKGTSSSVGSYLFGHDKIREVIYTEMGEAQRRLLHRRALSVLEALNRPAPELAHHARAAGLAEQAVRFSLAAGDEAIRLFANSEASLHYHQALEALSQLPQTADTAGLRVDTILKLVLASFMTMSVEQQYGLLAEAEDTAQALSDQRRLAHLHYWIGSTYSLSRNMRESLQYCERALTEAQEVGDENLAAQAAVQLSRILVLQEGNYGPIEGVLAPVIPILEQVANWREWIHALGTLGVARAGRGHAAAAGALVQRALDRARRTGDMKSREVMASHIYLSLIALHSGDFSQMLSESRQAVEGAEQLGEWLIVYLGYGLCAWAQSRLGQPEEGMRSMESAQRAGNRLGGQLTFFRDTFAAVTAELLLAANRVQEALAHSEAVVELAKEMGGILSAGVAQRVWGQGLAHLSRWDEAEIHLVQSWQTLLSGEILLEAARTQVAWGLLCRDRGDTASAQEHFEQAAAQFEASGLTRELETVQSYLAQIGQS
jgi:tetratricopeptide (TPR) repeat protein/transcriptional regulator with XRE-family HTH domain